MTDVEESARVAAVDATGLFGSAADERFDRITRVVREVLGMPGAEINLIGAHELFHKSLAPDSSERVMDRDDTMCNLTIQRKTPLIVTNALTDPRVVNVPGVGHNGTVQFYAGAQLRLPPEYAVGTLCVYDMQPREFSSEAERELKELATWAEREILAASNRVRSFAVPHAVLAEPDLADGYFASGLSMPLGDAAGDFYSLTRSGDTLTVTLADVMGKGSSAAMLATYLRSSFDNNGDLEVAEAIDAVNLDTWSRLSAAGSFATVFHGRIDIETGTLDYVDAGHGLTIIVSTDGVVTRLHSIDIPLGISSDSTWKAQSVTLGAGDILVSLSDGVLDLYDGTLSALDSIAAATRSAATIREGIEQILQRASLTGREDDITAIVIARRR